MRGLSGKTALVTGAGSGIGRASARRFAEEGADVVVADVIEETGRETVGLIEDAGGNARFVEVDVSDLASVERMVDIAVETYGSLDFAHNNAGILTDFVEVTELEEERWDRLIDINLKGIWACLKAELPVMVEQGHGAIVNTASEAGLVGMGGLASYSASKHGVVGLTKTVALEYATRGVRVNAIAPGPTKTNIQSGLLGGASGSSPTSLRERVGTAIKLLRTAIRTLRADFDTSAMRDVPMDRIAEPEEMAGAVAFLCSSDASYITGHTVPIDGGQAAD
ncbi:NAD(P)-dependent dehydrogenase, short-chain alcohol dehydrogenase family [Halopelagius inordinatus]|uniref:NAD(P)-dependent dehydrogenase, short-chain alcohol dehydrogenase family n=1 Tax=Halopelagius inordinatus TaxID=553467 RepID=A0A1I2RV50_9EURY|nr:SDR family oxidoreductase [Halopelagius inordinatus]SFG41636.1 NAD(P)-dependent dehydrogenase, short-chain alcohol dehydrogenase family [Halopelagius inordinatus]